MCEPGSTNLVPQGRLKEDWVAVYFSAVPSGLSWKMAISPTPHEACITNATAADSLAQRCDSALSRFLPSAVSW